jgi:predicted ATPase
VTAHGPAATHACGCVVDGPPRFIVVTGGPGAGKTAVLELAQRHFCKHVVVLPEAASMLFRGGLRRAGTPRGKRAVQRAIYRVQRELEEIALAESDAAVVLCDRGTLDGIAYWPDQPDSFFSNLTTSEAEELRRYVAVIHLRTPFAHNGYDYSNPLRIETASEAQAIDERIVEAWKHHPRVVTIPSVEDFMAKAAAAIEALAHEVSQWRTLEGALAAALPRHQGSQGRREAATGTTQDGPDVRGSSGAALVRRP